MLFNSVQFICFFPVAVLVFFVLPHKLRHPWLLIASYYYYMCWNAQYAVLIAASTVITFIVGLLIEEARDDKRLQKVWVSIGLVSNLSILFVFKYFNFLFASISSGLAKIGVTYASPALDVLLPVGISFYTFQALGYTIDVYRGDCKAERNPLEYALFVSFFPQLVAGPIERSKNLLAQMHENQHFDRQRAKMGMELMLWGYFEKIVIADRAAILVNQLFGNYQQYAFAELFFGAVMFTVQIYCDFGGYSHIAIGAAQIMGFTLMDNFRQPYFSTSIPDFWRRWHISLSTWFRDYLYIPLGGNRKGTARKYLNLVIVFLVSGLWHGASWNFAVWGGLHGIYQVLGGLLRPWREKAEKLLRINTDVFSFRLLQRLVTFMLVVFAYIFFRASNFSMGAGYVQQMFSAFNLWAWFDGASIYTWGLGRREFWLLMAAIAALFWVDLQHERGMKLRETLERQNLVFRWGMYIVAVMVVLIFGSYGNGYSASSFIYFQF